MCNGGDMPATGAGAIEVVRRGPEDESALRRVLACFEGLPLAGALQVAVQPELWVIRLDEEARAQLGPGHDTLGLSVRLAGPGDGDGGGHGCTDTDTHTALEREILAAWLVGPVPQRFPSVAELQAALRIRGNIVRAARATRLAFDTRAIARPAALWAHDDERGFVVRPGVSLIDALRRATQPGSCGTLYAFSCYRATEYVMLLGLAEELQRHRPAMYEALERLWQQRAVVSGEFHDTFLRETGSAADPLPMGWYVPGDRVWFRNPDEASADVSGYEGSWVIYLGGGHFGNFWQRERPYALDAKCIEVYHWRHAVVRDEADEPRIDETRVAEHLAASRADPAASAAILQRMQRYRDSRGVYADGGCIDSTREQIKWVCEGTGDLVLPVQ